MDILNKPRFAEIDTALRIGTHVSSGDYGAYEFVAQNFDELSELYSKYGATLVAHPDGFYFLNTVDSVIPSRVLPKSCTHLGKLLAYLAREPETIKTGGTITFERVLQTMSTMFSPELVRRIYTWNGNGADKHVIKEIERALRLLANLGFVQLEGGLSKITFTPAIGRFVDVAKHDNDPSQAARKDLRTRRGISFAPFDDTKPDEDDEIATN